jgi:hypothetical protein
MKGGFVLFCSFVLWGAFGSLNAQPWSGILASSRAQNWANAGVVGGIPNRTAQCGSTINAYSGTADAINNAIAGCASGQYVQLGAGTFHLTTGITWWANSAVSNVTLRGMGADQTFLVFTGGTSCGGYNALVCVSPPGSTPGTENNVCDWTAGYSQGSTTITLANCGTTTPATGSISNLKIGGLITLDQVDPARDNGGVWVCDQGPASGNPVCANEGNGASARNNGPCVNGICDRELQQEVIVTNCPNTDGVHCTSGAGITIAPGIFMANWATTQRPQAYFPTTTLQGNGLENLSIDDGGVYVADQNVTISSCNGCWIKGIRSLTASRSHVLMAWTTHCAVVDSYFYANLTHQSESYGLEGRMVFDSLIQNNIFQQVTDNAPGVIGTGNVAAYNFDILTTYNTTPGWMQGSPYIHAGGDSYNLFEGNIGPSFVTDNVHGTHHLSTLFRNFLPGWQSNCGGAACASQTVPINLASGTRYFNVVGNVLGTSGYHNQYQCTATNGSACSNAMTSVYSLGFTGGVGNASTNITGYCTSPACSATGNYDPQTVAYAMRWGNWDVVNGSTQWNSSEVPSGIGSYANAVPSSQTLPASFYLSSTSAPQWWGALPWPAIGPDVSGGNLGQCSGGNYAKMPATAGSQCAGGSLVSALGGHANAIPAMVCAFSVMSMPVDGSGAPLTFNANTCYGSSSSPTPPAPPTSPKVQTVK